MTEGEIIKAAVISRCGQYRYRLSRYWGPGPMLPFVMLNPSTADANKDDPTIRRCMAFARREGAGGIVVANLCAFRATSPAKMLAEDSPFGPENEGHLIEIGATSVVTNMPIVCAWGSHGSWMAPPVIDLFKRQGARLVCFGKTAGGQPRHPLYVLGTQPLVPLLEEVMCDGSGI